MNNFFYLFTELDGNFIMIQIFVYNGAMYMKSNELTLHNRGILHIYISIVWKYVSMNEDTFIYEIRYLCTGHELL